MPQKVRIALDAMGGDFGASVVIPGAAISLSRHPDTEFLLFGDAAMIEPQLAQHPGLKAASRVFYTSLCLRMLSSIDRPALAAIWPTARGNSVVLDLGATIGGDASHLVALAVMGSAMASVLFNLERPSVGLLNIGVEEMKGHEEIREAAELLRAMNLPQLNYVGFVEGDGIGKGAAVVAP